MILLVVPLWIAVAIATVAIAPVAVRKSERSEDIRPAGPARLAPEAFYPLFGRV